EFPAAREVAFAARRRLLADPAQKAAQLRCLAQLLNRRIEGREGLVGVGRVDHAMTLRAEQLDMVLRTALGPRQAMVSGQLLALEGPAAEAARDGRSVGGHQGCSASIHLRTGY